MINVGLEDILMKVGNSLDLVREGLHIHHVKGRREERLDFLFSPLNHAHTSCGGEEG